MNLARGDATLLAHNLSNGVALDFDWADQCIYWSDVTRQASHIKRLCEMNTTNLGGANSNSTHEVNLIYLLQLESNNKYEILTFV